MLTRALRRVRAAMREQPDPAPPEPQTCWEDQISLNSLEQREMQTLPPVSELLHTETYIPPESFLEEGAFETHVSRDPWPLPATEEREGYCGDRHLEYWLMGLRDYRNLRDIAAANNLDLDSYLDLGCASGRVLRHFAANEPQMQVFGCDINALHVAWCNTHLPGPTVFQNTSIPHLPLPDACLSLISGFSVFTHIEAFETTWLMELRRVLKPGGVACLTIHSEHTLKAMAPDWPLYTGIIDNPDFNPDMVGRDNDFDRITLRFSRERSYTSNVFLHTRHIEQVWGRFFTILEIRREFPQYQDLVIMQKA